MRQAPVRSSRVRAHPANVFRSGSWYDSLQARYTLRELASRKSDSSLYLEQGDRRCLRPQHRQRFRPVLPVTIGDDAFDRPRNGARTRQRAIRHPQPLRSQLRLRAAAAWTARPPQNGLLVGGWQINGIFQVQSGNPFTVVNSATTAQSLTVPSQHDLQSKQFCEPERGNELHVLQHSLLLAADDRIESKQ